MTDPAANNLDAHLIDPNNNVINNMGDNNNNGNDDDMVDLMKNYRDIMTASSSSRPQPQEGTHPSQNYEPNVF